MITDKELLTFCNLANLEMEYANLIKKEKKKDENGNSLDEEIETNHTIYSLIDEEINSFNSEKAEIWNGLFFNSFSKNSSIGKENQEAAKKRLNEFEEKYKILKEKKIGSFYSVNENNEVLDYIYFCENDLKRKAPLALERYERLKYGDEKKKNEFLNKWEVLEYCDIYNYTKYLYDFFIEKSKLAKEEANNLLKKYDSDVKDELKNMDLEEKKFISDVKNFLLEISKKEIPKFKSRDEIKKMKEKYLKIRAGKMIFTLLTEEALSLGIQKLPNFLLKKISGKVYSKLYKKKIREKIYEKILEKKSVIKYSEKRVEKITDSILKKNNNKINNIIDYIFDEEYSANILKKEISNTKISKIVKEKIKTSRWLTEIGISENLSLTFIEKIEENASSSIVEKVNKTSSKKILEKGKEEIAKKIEKKFEENKVQISLTNFIGVDQEFDLSETGVSILVLRNLETQEYAFVLKNSDKMNEELNKELNQSIIPTSLFQLEMFILYLIEKYKIEEKKITVSGVGVAGKLVAAYKLYNEKINCKSYLGENPKNIGYLVDFDKEDFELLKKEYKSRNIINLVGFTLWGETDKENAKFIIDMIGLVASIPAGVGLVTLMIYCFSKGIELMNNAINEFKLRAQIGGFFYELWVAGVRDIYSRVIIGEIFEDYRKEEYKFICRNRLDLKEYSSNLKKMFSKIDKTEIKLENLEDLVTISLAINIYGYGILKCDENYLILYQEKLENIIIYNFITKEKFKLKSKKYTVETVYFSKKLEYRFQEEIPWSSSILKDEEKVPSAPEKNDNFYNEVFQLITGTLEDGVYYSKSSHCDEFELGEKMSKLIETFYIIQNNFKNFLGEKFGFIIDINKKEIEYAKYELDKKKIDTTYYIGEKYFLYFADEETGEIKV